MTRLAAGTRLRCIHAGNTLLAIGRLYTLDRYSFPDDDDLIELAEMRGVIWGLRFRFTVEPEPRP